MDTGEGYFKQLESLDDAETFRDQFPRSKGVFSVNEIIELKGSKFRIVDISPFGLKLKLLKQ